LPLLRVAVNLSHRQFTQESLIQVVREALHITSVDPSRLELELTEAMVMRNPERAEKVLAQLKELGVRLVVDDFGTGLSSLKFLNRLPLDSVKIDRSLILDLPRNRDAAALTRGVVAMAHSLNLRVIAESVETSEQWARRCRATTSAHPCPRTSSPASCSSRWRRAGAPASRRCMRGERRAIPTRVKPRK
jgi:EAL domain-containing protein (putative c-di-GMP-specific phosphodiesterase class I)